MKKSYWTYGIIRRDVIPPPNIANELRKNGFDPVATIYGIHEIYYRGKEENPHSWTLEPEISAESVKELRAMLEQMLKALDQPILVELDKENKLRRLPD